MKQPISILLADPHFLSRMGFVGMLEGLPGFHLLGQAESQKELTNMVKEHRPNVIIFDYYNNDVFRPEDIKKMREISPLSNFLVVSSDNNKEQIFEVIGFGARGFLTKHCSREEIIRAIRATANNEKFFCNKVLDIILEKQATKGPEDCSPTSLSSREIEILALVAEGLSTKVIAAQLFLSPHTINTHRKNIKKKLGISSTSKLLMYAVNAGIVQL